MDDLFSGDIHASSFYFTCYKYVLSYPIHHSRTTCTALSRMTIPPSTMLTIAVGGAVMLNDQTPQIELHWLFVLPLLSTDWF